MGSRLRGKIYPKAMPWLHHWVGTPFLTGLINLFFKVKISDVNCGLRGFKKEAIEKLDLRCNGMEFASEMVAKAGRGKLNIKEVPISYYPTSSERVPSLRSFSDGWGHLRFLVIFYPKYLVLFTGFFIFLLGLFLTAILLFRTKIAFGAPLGLSTTIFAGACLLMGIQVMLFGVCAIIFNGSKGLIEHSRISNFFKKNFTLEKGLVVGGVVFGLGVITGLITMVLFSRFATNFPNVYVLTKLRIVSIFTVLLGIQIIFSSFYISLFNITETLD